LKASWAAATMAQNTVERAPHLRTMSPKNRDKPREVLHPQRSRPARLVGRRAHGQCLVTIGNEDSRDCLHAPM